MESRLKPTVFLDRDGTIIIDRHYLSEPSGVALLPKAVEGLQRFRDLGFSLVLITNQSGVARGYFSMAAVEAVQARLEALLSPYGIQFDGTFICPHQPRDDCDCRKPRPGLIDQACAALPIDLSRSLVIGDKASDVALGRARGIPSILVLTGQGTADGVDADVVVTDLLAAAEWTARQNIAREGRA